MDGNFNPVNYPFGGAFFNSHPTYAGIVDQTIDGQAMMKVPKFWFKTGTVPSGTYAGKRYWMISDRAAPGFAVHPAFMNYGAEVAQYWVGKYQGTEDGLKVGSQAGRMPLVSIDFPTMQVRATNRNVSGVSGFMMWSIYQLAAVRTLCLIEMGSSNSQVVIGEGNTNSVGVSTVDSSFTAAAGWRGIIGLWGNVWQMVDGLSTDSNTYYRIWETNGSRSFVVTNQLVPGAGWLGSVARDDGTNYDLSLIFAAAATADGDNSYGSYSDYHWQSSGPGIAYHGGQFDQGGKCGLFNLSVGALATNFSHTVGTRLAKY